MSHSDKTNNYTEFFYKAFRNILLVSIPLLVVSGVALFHLSIHSSATVSDLETDNLTLTLSTSCTLSSSIEEAHEASLNGGQYEDDIGVTKVNAYCNDNNGYSIYAIGSSNNVDGNADLVSNINDNYNIHTGIYDSGSITPSSPSTWSMKLAAGVGSGVDTTPPTIRNNYDSYSVVPENYTLVASRASKTDMTIDTSVTGSYFTTTYDIYASSLQPAGTYTGKVKYLMVHPQSNSQYFGFNEVFAANGKGAINVDGNSYYTMQDMTSDICSKVELLNEASATQLVDIRDNKLYWVAKLEDGHCWITQNLDLDLTTYTNEQGQEVMKPFTSNDTDLTDHSLTGAYSDGYAYNTNTGATTWTPERKTIDFQNTTVTGWANDNNNPYSANKTDSTEVGHASLGNYYNWTAAIASNNSSSLTQSTLNDTTKNPKNSICPKGWRLPTISNQPNTISGSTNEFARLNYLYNNNLAATSVGMISAPLYFAKKGGAIYTAQLFSYNERSNYFSSTNYSANSSFRLNIGESSVLPDDQFSDVKQYGYSLRCLAR